MKTFSFPTAHEESKQHRDRLGQQGTPFTCCSLWASPTKAMPFLWAAFANIFKKENERGEDSVVFWASLGAATVFIKRNWAFVKADLALGSRDLGWVVNFTSNVNCFLTTLHAQLVPESKSLRFLVYQRAKSNSFGTYNLGEPRDGTVATKEKSHFSPFSASSLWTL